MSGAIDFFTPIATALGWLSLGVGCFVLALFCASLAFAAVAGEDFDDDDDESY